MLSASDDGTARLNRCRTCQADTGDLADQIGAQLEQVPEATLEPETSAELVSAGTCVADLPEVVVLPTVDPVDCDRPHAYEVFGALQVPDPYGEPVPDDLESRATEACEEMFFDDYVGVPPDDSRYEVEVRVPTERSWDYGDRSVLCLLTNQEGEMSSSARGSES